MRNVQHKKEAYWFYRFLSIFYDNYVNPFFWTQRMRREALELAKFDRRDLLTLDVGSGTGFTTLGIVEKVAPENVSCLDQSPHQMAKAQRKAELFGCHFRLGDAEDLPFPADFFDRYVSAGSIEYWPEPQRGITEAYRVLKPGGIALMIGPLRPQNRLSRFLADAWMLFPEEEEYFRWFEQAGFRNIQKRYVAPNWVMREKYGIAIAGRKAAAGESPLQLGEKKERLDEPLTIPRAVSFVKRLFIGLAAGFFFIPLAIFAHLLKPFRKMFIKKTAITTTHEPEPLTLQQRSGLLAILTVVLAVIVYFILHL